MLRHYIHLCSEDARVEADSSYTFALPTLQLLPQEIQDGYEYVIALQSATIPVSWYNINSNNNTLNVTESELDDSNATTHTLTLTQGNPNGYDFASQLQTVLNSGTSNSTVYSVTFSPTNYTLTLSTDTSNRKTVINLGSCTCSAMLGLASTGSATLTTASDLTSTYPINLLGSVLSVNVRLLNSAITGKGQIESVGGGSVSNLLAKILVDVGNFDVISYKSILHNPLLLTSDSINIIQLAITDSSGVAIDFNNQEWELPLILEKLLTHRRNQTFTQIQSRINKLEG
jgi:hypothetical protein